MGKAVRFKKVVDIESTVFDAAHRVASKLDGVDADTVAKLIADGFSEIVTANALHVKWEAFLESQGADEHMALSLEELKDTMQDVGPEATLSVFAYVFPDFDVKVTFPKDEPQT